MSVTEQRMHALAEHMAEGGSVAAWARLAGLSQSMGNKLWQRIKRQLGEQAR